MTAGLFSHARGQASSEYFVLFAATLIIAMLAITILSSMLGSSADKLKAETDAYWGSTSPFSISGASQPSGSTTVFLRLENRVPAYLTLHNVTLESAGNLATNNTEKIFTNGMALLMSVEGAPANCSGREGSYAKYNVRITYDQQPLVGKVQEGAKPLYVRCD